MDMTIDIKQEADMSMYHSPVKLRSPRTSDHMTFIGSKV